MKKRLRFIIGISGILLLICIILLFAANLLIVNNAKGKIYSEVDSIRTCDVGLLLGTTPQTRIGRRPNQFFRFRIDAAEQLYKEGKIKRILISGDENSLDGVNEVVCMRDSLVGRGVPAEDIFLDGKGFRTLDAVVRAVKVYDVQSFVVISQKFHNERAIYLAEHLGLDVHNITGFNAADATSNMAVMIYIREYFARVKVFLDILTNKTPLTLERDEKSGNTSDSLHHLSVFGIPLIANDKESVINKLLEGSDDIKAIDDGNKATKVECFGIPFGLNIRWNCTLKQAAAEEVTLITSRKDKMTFLILKNGLVNHYGEPDVEEYEEGQEEIEGRFIGRCSWYGKYNVTLRTLHTEDGGFILIFSNSNINE